MLARVIIALLLLAASDLTEGRALGQVSSAPAQVRCNAAGAKLFAPAMTPAAICARFGAALKSVGRAGETLAIALSFHPNGVATAIVTVSRGAATSPPRDFNLAVSDRRFSAADIDRLAASVVAGLRQAH